MVQVAVHPIKTLCTERGLKLGWVAQRLGISPGYLSSIMCGDRRPPTDFYKKVSVLLDVEVERIRPAEVAV